MSNNKISWSRKYRPKDLEEYVGNDFLKNKLLGLISKDKLPQTLLFTGTQGTGKTTIARLLAKSILCEHSINGKPCNECDKCTTLNEQFIGEGESPRNVNVYEYNIGKANTVKDANDIIANMTRRISNNSIKVVILDEIQRATYEAQSSFLKVTEEPPENVYIILCTTNPEDLISPFKSRFNTLEVKKPTSRELVDRLEHICREENVRFSRPALSLIADSCKRIPRESIMRLELIASIGDVTLEAVEKELGVINTSLYNEYINILLNKDINDLLVFVEDLSNNKNIEPYYFLAGLSDYIIDLLYIDKGVMLDKYTDGVINSMKKINKDFDEKLKLNIIKSLSNISNKNFSGQFILIGITLHLMDSIIQNNNIENKDELSVEEQTSKLNYKEVTNKINSHKKVDINEEMSLEDFKNMIVIKK